MVRVAVRILVTGAAGFLGSACVRHFVASHHRVMTTDRRDGVDFVGDLSDRKFVGCLPDADVLVHTAGVQYVSPDLPFFHRQEYFERNNVLTAKNLSCRYAGASTHIVNIGTSMMYDQSGREVYDVGDRMRPQGLYSASKLAAHLVLVGMPNRTASVIPCITAGAGRAGLFSWFIRSALRLRTVVYPGAGNHPVHVAHVNDVASLVACVVEERAVGMFHAACHDALSIQGWVNEIADELKLSRVRTVHLPLEVTAVASAMTGYRFLAPEQLLMLRFPHVLSLETSLALGWNPCYTSAQVLRETARALVNDNVGRAR
jgi:nucleoside-diphosphate-sugar epimerase